MNGQQTPRVGTWPAYETVRNSPVETGAYFTDADVSGKKRVAVIGHQTLLDLFGDEGLEVLAKYDGCVLAHRGPPSVK